MLSNIFITAGTEVLVVLLLLLVYKVAAARLSEEQFAEFMLGRRAMALALSIFLLGTTIGIPRFMGMNITQRHQAVKYWLAGVICVGVFTVAGIAAAMATTTTTSQLIFGNSNRANLIAPLSCFITSVIAHQLIYAYFQGMLKMAYANWLKLINIGIVPLAGVLLSSSTREVFTVTALLTGGVSALSLLIVLRENAPSLRSLPLPSRKEMGVLLSYSMGHIPGNLGFSAFFSVPAFIASHIAGITAGGNMSLSLSILYMVEGLLAPVSIVLLPEASRLAHIKNFSALRKYASILALITISLGSLIGVVFWFWGDLIFRLYLGSVSPALYSTARIVMLGAVPLLIYSGFRAMIYALYFLPVNTFNILGGLAVTLGITSVCWHSCKNAECIATALVAGLWFLAIASLMAFVLGVRKGKNAHAQK